MSKFLSRLCHPDDRFTLPRRACGNRAVAAIKATIPFGAGSAAEGAGACVLHSLPRPGPADRDRKSRRPRGTLGTAMVREGRSRPDYSILCQFHRSAGA